MKKETYVYASLKERIASEYKVFAVAFIFVIIADAIGQVKIPLGSGMLILFPIFYAIILGGLSGPEVAKVFKEKEVKSRFQPGNCGDLPVYC